MMDHKYDTAVQIKNLPTDTPVFRPLPQPRWPHPYRLDIAAVLGKETELLHEKMSFHMLGDTGSLRHSDFQSLVANTLNDQSNRILTENKSPAFLYHLGDIVYNHGEASAYPKQFLQPYENYEAPIFAIPGNHDGDVNPESPVPYKSLEPFMEVFCGAERRTIEFGQGSKRQSMMQPNVYWTLETPLARFIGLYSNIPKHGWIGEEQREWFVEELRYAKQHAAEQAVIVCIHHAPFSADTNHGSSKPMIDFLEEAFIAADIKPDLVVSGHVHNYQRFSRIYADGATVPFVVAGAGGYSILHSVAEINDPWFEKLPVENGEVKLEAFCEDQYGFLKMAVEKTPAGLILSGEYYTIPQDAIGKKKVEPELYERFEFRLSRL
ncbi:metallophosphoesterase family protein [Sphingobacterium pedocola]|uniref:Metallophosphoesterase n=1 Tax=Sphingobacterium pedocola TaxID=2082722 RepID=A0ABR9T3N7_9SPHI|nr:metallophosphoesterase [Sphingobacterium pedocola]MBE8719272.1 metallophosphoesterase [Sphingobacterium pedocola]